MDTTTDKFPICILPGCERLSLGFQYCREHKAAPQHNNQRCSKCNMIYAGKRTEFEEHEKSCTGPKPLVLISMMPAQPDNSTEAQIARAVEAERKRLREAVEAVYPRSGGEVAALYQ